jgi:ketosteroid isomerase-like protein
MKKEEARQFCEKWLPTWTGNRPQELSEFYAEDAFYSDPVQRSGLTGRAAILPYLEKLLKHNPEWIWTAEEIIETVKGFTLKWRAEIPVAGQSIVEYGLDIVEIVDGRIVRNEVYFDRVAMLAAMQGKR